MAGFERFQKAILDAATQHYKPLIEEHKEELGESIKNHLFDLDGPKQIKRQPKSRDQYFGNLFRGFLEISKSLETLDDIHFYIRRFPFSGTHITPDRYLQFHVESHYAEIYILRARLSRYVTFIKRQFRRDPNLSDVQKRCEELMQSIDNSLKDVVKLRGRHIHEIRFTDSGIDRLSTIAILTKGSDDELTALMKDYYKEQRREVKKTWVRRTKINLDAIRQLLDILFDALLPIAFDQKGVIRYPNGARA